MTNVHRNARTRGKVWEREAAKDLGTKRTGPTGLNDADVIHDVIALECKALAKLMLRGDHWAQAKRNAAGRVPVLAVKEFGTGEKVAIVPWAFFVALLNKEN